MLKTIQTFLNENKAAEDKKEFKDTKGVIKIHKSIKNRQYDGQRKKYKKTKNDL